jgi:hypothetical protein
MMIALALTTILFNQGGILKEDAPGIKDELVYELYYLFEESKNKSAQDDLEDGDYILRLKQDTKVEIIQQSTETIPPWYRIRVLEGTHKGWIVLIKQDYIRRNP